jgi:hypothetical protein
LKFTEAAGLPYGWQPHLYRSSRPYTSGRVRFACELLLPAEQASTCFLALRDYRPGRGEYREGPSLTIRADGALLAAGRELTKVPTGKWFRLELQLDLGSGGDPATIPAGYRLILTVPGQEAQVFDRVPYLHAQFGQLMWFGFSSAGQPGTSFFVDDIQLQAPPGGP